LKTGMMTEKKGEPVLTPPPIRMLKISGAVGVRRVAPPEPPSVGSLSRKGSASPFSGVQLTHRQTSSTGETGHEKRATTKPIARYSRDIVETPATLTNSRNDLAREVANVAIVDERHAGDGFDTQDCVS